MINSAYAKAAIEALMNWNKKSLEEAQEIVSTHTRAEVEDMCFAEGSVKTGFEALIASFKSKGIEISKEQEQDLYSVILDGPENSPLMKNLTTRLVGIDREGIALDALTKIHDNWVKESETKLDRMGREYIHTPLETIGWDVVYYDYIFLKPVIESMGIPIENERNLISRYEDMQVKYFERNGVSDRVSLAKHIEALPNNYEAIEAYSEEHKAKFINNPEIVKQVYENSGFENLKDRIVNVDQSSLSKKAAELKGLLEQKAVLEEVPLPEVKKDVTRKDHDD